MYNGLVFKRYLENDKLSNYFVLNSIFTLDFPLYIIFLLLKYFSSISVFPPLLYFPYFFFFLRIVIIFITILLIFLFFFVLLSSSFPTLSSVIFFVFTSASSSFPSSTTNSSSPSPSSPHLLLLFLLSSPSDISLISADRKEATRPSHQISGNHNLLNLLRISSLIQVCLLTLAKRTFSFILYLIRLLTSFHSHFDFNSWTVKKLKFVLYCVLYLCIYLFIFLIRSSCIFLYYIRKKSEQTKLK